MVKLRLKRIGSKKRPVYRVVVINSQEKREGRPIAEIGVYNPKSKELRLDRTAALDWIKKGAQPSETVKYLIDNSDENGNLVRKAEPVEPKLSRKAKSRAEAEKKAQEAAA